MKYNFWLLFVIIFSANFLNAQNFKEYQLLSKFKVDLNDYEKKVKISIYEKHGSEQILQVLRIQNAEGWQYFLERRKFTKCIVIMTTS